MSAFIVSKLHIDAMVTAGLELLPRRMGPLTWFHRGNWHKLEVEHADRVGQMLVDENVKSVSHRYASSIDEGLPGPIAEYWRKPYRFARCSGEALPGAIYRACQCYEYQACEHEEWPESEAHAFCEALKRAAVERMSDYVAADGVWDIHDKEQAFRGNAVPLMSLIGR